MKRQSMISRFKEALQSEKIAPQYDESRQFVEDPLLTLIFAPDPVTGNPSSDLALTTRTNSPELQRYIQSVLHNPVPSSPGIDDPDMALDMQKDPFESFEVYASRLREIVQNTQ